MSKALLAGSILRAERVAMLLKDFTAPECERLRELCNFTQEELAVFNLRVKGKSIVEIQIALNLTESTVNRRIRDVKKKIARVM